MISNIIMRYIYIIFLRSCYIKMFRECSFVYTIIYETFVIYFSKYSRE